MKPIMFDPLDFMKNTLKAISEDINEPSVSKDKKVHSIRVMSKKLRSLLYLIKPSMQDKELFKIQKQFYKELSSILSKERETKVMLDSFMWTIKACKLSIDDFKDIQAALEQNIENKTVNSSNIDQDLQICKQSILMALDNLDILEKASDPVMDWKAGFQKTYEKAYDYLNLALLTRDTEDIHMFRKYAKYHMYQILFLSDEIKDLKKRYKKLDKLTSMLGKCHDLALFEDYLYGKKDLKNSDTLITHVNKKHNMLTKKALKQATEIFKRSPNKFKLPIDANQ